MYRTKAVSVADGRTLSVTGPGFSRALQQPREGSDDEPVEAKCEVHVADARFVTSVEPGPLP
jgi:hypothetical protein